MIGNRWDSNDNSFLFNIIFDYDKGLNPAFRINMMDASNLYTFDSTLLLDFILQKYLLNEWVQYRDANEGFINTISLGAIAGGTFS